MNRFKFHLIVLLLLSCLTYDAYAGTYWLTHCGGEIAGEAYPVVECEATVRVATFFDESEMAPLIGNRITSLRIGIISKLKLDGLYAWIAESPDGSPLANVHIEKSALKSGWNEIALDSPLKITGKPLYVGYTFFQPLKCNVISVTPSPTDYPLLLDSGNGWEDLSSDCHGALSVEVGVEGENTVTKDIALTNVKAEYPVIEAGSYAFLTVDFINAGTEPMSSLAYVADHPGGSVAGEALFDKVEPREKGRFLIRLPLERVSPSADAKINVVGIDGDRLTVPRVGSVSIESAPAPLLQRRVLVEEFSNESCNNCPQAAIRLHENIASLDEAYRVSLAVHHAGSGYDAFTIDASKEYESFYPNGKYSPMAMFDRTPFDGAIDTNPNMEDQIRIRLEQSLSRTACTSLSMMPYIDTDNGLIEVRLSGALAENRQSAVTLFLTEDNVMPRRQSGAPEGYVHNNVLRSCGPVWGDPVETAEDGTFNVSVRTSYDTSWKTDDCRLIAFLTDNDPSSPEYRQVLQSISLPLPYAEKARIGSGPGEIRELSVRDDCLQFVINGGNLEISTPYIRADIFTIDGIRIPLSGLLPGTYILRVMLEDGHTVIRKFQI